MRTSLLIAGWPPNLRNAKNVVKNFQSHLQENYEFCNYSAAGAVDRRTKRATKIVESASDRSHMGLAI